MAEENIGGEEGIIEERRKKLQLLRDKNTAYINDFLKEHYANDLHGQYLASLRNKENETAKSLILSIDLNKEFITQSYENTLSQFRNDITDLYNSLIPFP